MQTKNVVSLSEYLGVVEDLAFESAHEEFVFRGQASRGNLVPGIARPQPKDRVDTIEQEMLNEYLRIATTKLTSAESDPLGTLISAQHHGMRTRLLDWSTNALTALWFACADRDKNADVYVYVLEADKRLMPPAKIADPFKLKKTVLIKPNLMNPRMAAQDGCFTLHLQLGTHRFLPLEKNKSIRPFLTEIVIERAHRNPILKALNRCGINSSALFPDLEGAGRYVNWKFDVPNRPTII